MRPTWQRAVILAGQVVLLFGLVIACLAWIVWAFDRVLP